MYKKWKIRMYNKGSDKMAKYIKGISRGQACLFPERIDDYVEKENEVRVIDAFVESLDMEELGFERANPKETGRPGYDPRDMLKLYLYGYKSKIRSSRNLEKACRTNVEVMWLMKKIVPDFRCISDFRKESKGKLKEVFKEFIFICKSENLISNEISQDGVKIKANWIYVKF